MESQNKKNKKASIGEFHNEDLDPADLEILKDERVLRLISKIQKSQKRSDSCWLTTAFYLFAVIGVATILSGLFPATNIELDHGGYICIRESSWWGLHCEAFSIRLQDVDQWEVGKESVLRVPVGYDWFVQGSKGEWLPLAMGDSFDSEKE